MPCHTGIFVKCHFACGLQYQQLKHSGLFKSLIFKYQYLLQVIPYALKQFLQYFSTGCQSVQTFWSDMYVKCFLPDQQALFCPHPKPFISVKHCFVLRITCDEQKDKDSETHHYLCWQMSQYIVLALSVSAKVDIRERIILSNNPTAIYYGWILLCTPHAQLNNTCTLPCVTFQYSVQEIIGLWMKTTQFCILNCYQTTKL